MVQKDFMNSDNPNEDRGYDRNHSQTDGGIKAYIRGEMPLSYWKKKIILKKVCAEFRKVKRDRTLYNRYKKLLLELNMSEQELLTKLSKAKLDELKKYLLTIRGTHYTGNYFRYTKFYGLVNPNIMMIRIGNKLVEPNTVTQLKLDIGV